MDRKKTIKLGCRYIWAERTQQTLKVDVNPLCTSYKNAGEHVVHSDMHRYTHTYTYKQTCMHTHTWQPWGYLQDRMGDGAGGRKRKHKEWNKVG